MKVDVEGNAITAAMRDIKFYEGDLYIASDNGIAVIRAPSTTKPPLQLTILVPGIAIFEGVVRTQNHVLPFLSFAPSLSRFHYLLLPLSRSFFLFLSHRLYLAFTTSLDLFLTFTHEFFSSLPAVFYVI